MNRISIVTRRDIQELFLNGIDMGIFDVKVEVYPYHGRLNEIEFLRRMYKLDTIPCNDSKFDSAEKEIWQHTVNNEDYPLDWIFDDNRFPLKNGTDEDFLKFICEVFHPEVRIEGELCKSYFDKIDTLLHADRYELYEVATISGRSVYGWREITEEEAARGGFLPFSLRYKKDLDKGTIKLSISKTIRNDVLSIMNRNEQQEDIVSETNWHYSKPTKEAVFNDLHMYSEPKCFDEFGKYSNAVDLDRFITNNLPQCVFDAIELYNRYQSGQVFTREINIAIHSLGWQIFDGKLMKSVNVQIAIEEPQTDDSLKDLIQQAETYFKHSDNNHKQLAVEKIWDAFEHLKTYYSSDKKESAGKVVCTIARGNEDLKQRITNEFNELSTIGNKYQIRHFETGKIAIENDSIKEYLYYRCLALINLAIKSIEG